MLRDIIVNKMNKLGKERIPFLFIIDFKGQQPIVVPLSDIDSNTILFSLNAFSNMPVTPNEIESFSWKPKPINYSEYKNAFDIVKNNLDYGNSYLTNLTFPTQIETNLTLKDIFLVSNAKYKLYFDDQFTVFSPETFIKIEKSKIFSYPMKGTIDADIPNAKAILLNDPKELSEHNTIVDLIRNDLSMVAKRVKVESFRFIDEIRTNDKNLLQASSKISGELSRDWMSNIGLILNKLLPAGSICGAPKEKTLEIIDEAETYSRGFYTGIMGVFDGTQLDSGVMIRFIEKDGKNLFYKSGGGITASSNPQLEYQELIDKIYVPITSGVYQN